MQWQEMNEVDKEQAHAWRIDVLEKAECIIYCLVYKWYKKMS